MDYKRYQKSRNAVWEILLENQVCELPVRVSRICKNMGIIIKFYCSDELSGDGKSVIIRDRPIILVNERCSLQRQRFTTAHELGHIILGHIGKYQLINREPSAKDNSIEQEANIFASRLLAPAIILRDLNVQSAEDVARICNISMQAAEFRWERLKRLYEREKLFIKERGYSCFGLHPLEREVQLQFSEYIRENKL